MYNVMLLLYFVLFLFSLFHKLISIKKNLDNREFKFRKIHPLDDGLREKNVALSAIQP